MTTFAELIERGEIRGMKLGLESMRALDAALGYPSKKFPAVHIAGTNGKGSVATKIANVLTSNGMKVGLFTSPHISTFRERIEINGAMIPVERAEILLERIMKAGTPTFFEALTALGFLYFAEEEVDIAVLEVGMGGRLDATNIITPLLSVVTSIGLDHSRYLGKTLEEIAREKAGIIKEGVPYILGPSAGSYIEGEVVQGSFTHFEEENRAVARHALLKLPFTLSTLQGLEVVPPCRFEELDGVILDVGHNPPALEALFKRLRQHYPGRGAQVLAAFSEDKEIAPCLEILRKEARGLFLTQADHFRAAPLSEVSLPQAFEDAYTTARREGDLLVCTGTFYMMDWIRRRLGAN